jgi:hypothetical protein
LEIGLEEDFNDHGVIDEAYNIPIHIDPNSA